MTREEAREALSVLKIYDAQWLREAVDMAIEALSAEPTDLISRADAIEAVKSLPNTSNGFSDTYDKAYIIGLLEELPSADRPSGEWLMFDGLYCSNCHYKLQTTGIPTYCPNCGARMENTK